MSWGGKYRRTSEQYRAIPAGWDEDSLVAEHARLNGTQKIRPREGFWNGSPWHRYRETLYNIAYGIRAGDAACTELAIRYIELHYIGSYAGYIRSLFGRRLKHARLTGQQCTRLARHFYALLACDERCREFEDYIGLWKQVIAPAELEAVHAIVQAGSAADKAFGEALLRKLGYGERRGRKQRPRPPWLDGGAPSRSRFVDAVARFP